VLSTSSAGFRRHQFLVAEHTPQELHLLHRQVGEVGQGALDDPVAFATIPNDVSTYYRGA
jgi:hypothetical protein